MVDAAKQKRQKEADHIGGGERNQSLLSDDDDDDAEKAVTLGAAAN